MKLRNIALIIVCVLLLSMVMIGAASAEEVHHTVTFHSGEDGLFENGENTNVLTYSLPWVEKEMVTQYWNQGASIYVQWIWLDDDGVEHLYSTSSYTRGSYTVFPISTGWSGHEFQEAICSSGLATLIHDESSNRVLVNLGGADVTIKMIYRLTQ